MGIKKLQREEDQAVVVERGMMLIRAIPMLLPCSQVEQNRDSEQRHHAWHLGRALPPYLVL